jgi:hypothetical protein
LRDEGFGLVGERVVKANFHEAEVGSQKLEARNRSLVHPCQCTAGFGGRKETMIVSEGRGKTNRPDGELRVSFR